MKLKQIKQRLGRHIINIPGWCTSRKIVVIESDDWGSIRMPSLQVYEKLLNAGIRVDKCPYNRFDSLENEEDLSSLFDVLTKFKDKNGKHPVFTANSVVSNPDFEKIQRSNYLEYHYELFTETLSKYPDCKNAFNVCMQGLAGGIFYPQFHGREHLNVNRWLNALWQGSAETLLAFSCNMFGISANISGESRKSYMAALDFDNPAEIETQKKIIVEGLGIFNDIFGYHSKSFIAPNYVWHSDLESILMQNKVKFIQGAGNQNQPAASGMKVIRHKLGERNKLNQIYLNRNCIFEPSTDPYKQWVGSTLKEIEIAFFWRKPAIITTHRVNYIGSIVPSNRKENLKLLSELLTKLIEKWPDVEFMTSDKLGELIENS